MVYRISVSESILYDSYLFKVAIIECFYCCMCIYKIIESFSNRCLLYQRERERERKEKWKFPSLSSGESIKHDRLKAKRVKSIARHKEKKEKEKKKRRAREVCRAP